MHKYDHKEIEKKWRRKWEETAIYKIKEDTEKKKYYILDMFPYPSGAGLHVGHPKGYIATDVFARMKMMQGFSVLHPFGWDAFGLPAENYALKHKMHPSVATSQNVVRFKEQMEILGMTYDWNREINTTDPEFYKWTQWIFMQMWKRGLAYESFEPINWCPSCKTALANEDLEQGRCERCDSEIERKPLRQWVLRITDYADRLLRDLDKLPEWDDSIKEIQKNWIGRSEGARIKFPILNFKFSNESDRNNDEPKLDTIEVYTTRPDTLFGATYLVVAPEHPLIKNFENRISNFEEVSNYIEEARHKSDLLRSELQKDKTGVELKGIKAVNPATEEDIPIWVADYVLAGYGTGAIMAVPAHDERDFEFAKKYCLPYKKVILPPKLGLTQHSVDLAVLYGGQAEMRVEAPCWTGDGEMTGSGEYSGMDSAIARTKIVEWLEEKGHGKKSVGYKIKDWVFSRQRYWGEPIPLVHCETCKNKKYKYLLLHGYKNTSKEIFFPWLKNELETAGHEVICLDLPNSDKPDVAEQVEFVLKNTSLDGDTVLLGHSLGGVVAMKLAERMKGKLAKLVLVDSFIRPDFNFDYKDDAIITSKGWDFDFEMIKSSAEEIILITSKSYPIIKEEQVKEMWNKLEAKLILGEPEDWHFCGPQEPVILKNILPDGWSAIPEHELPLELPAVESYEPSGTGESPLANITDWVETVCPRCGSVAKRETNTMPQWAGSSWYYLAYIMRGISDFKFPISKYKNALDKWLPVDFYVGGAEHAARHLIYARFWHKFLFDIGVLSHAEPFKRLQYVGLILAQDGRKMSKRWGNVINPDDIIDKYGADAMRLYEMFMGPFSQSCAWNMKGMVGMSRFLEKVIKLNAKCKMQNAKFEAQNFDSLVHKTIKKVSEDIEEFKFNTAISQLMILVNAMGGEDEVVFENYAVLLKLLAPFAPHISEQLWEEAGGGRETGSIFSSAWPEYDLGLIKDETFGLVVQINGKNRAVISVVADISEEDAYNLAVRDQRAVKWLEGKELIKKIYVKGKLVNFVTK